MSTIYSIYSPPPRKKAGSEFFELGWKLIGSGIHEIFQKNAKNLAYEEIYRTAYQLVLNRFGAELYERVEKSMKDRLVILAQKILQSTDETFLHDIASIWEDYKLAIDLIRDLVLYLDQNYVPSVLREKKYVYDNGVYLFKITILDDAKVGERIQRHILDLIKRDRAGESVDRNLMKRVVAVLADCLSYEEYLENALLQVTREHYKQFGNTLVQTASVHEYLLQVDAKLKEESKRIDDYLVEQTWKKFDDIMREELITNHMEYILNSDREGFTLLVLNDRYDELKHAYALFKSQPNAKDAMKDRFHSYIVEMTKAYVTDTVKLKNPITFVQGLFDLKKKFDDILKKSFEQSEEYGKALNDAVESCVNGNVQRRLAEYLSLFLDYLIKNLTETSPKEVLDEDLERAMVFFRFLADKDVFESYYKIHLSRRLLMGKTDAIQEEAEKLFIEKLKNDQGYMFTSKIEGMFNDMKVSNETMNNYINHSAYKQKDPNIDFQVHVLTASFWPSYPLSTTVLCPEMQKCCDSFSTFFNDVHAARKLTWQSSLGGGIVVAKFPLGQKEIMVTTTQMVILLLCNEALDKKISYKELTQKSQIPEKELKRNLLAMTNGKFEILLKEPKSDSIDENDSFTINKAFKSKHEKFKIGIAIKKEAEDRKQRAERKPQLEGAIVRIMREHKRLEFNQLLEMAVNELKSTLAPTTAEMKRRIESLCEREHLKRDPEDSNIILYNVGK